RPHAAPCPTPPAGVQSPPRVWRPRSPVTGPSTRHVRASEAIPPARVSPGRRREERPAATRPGRRGVRGRSLVGFRCVVPAGDGKRPAGREPGNSRLEQPPPVLGRGARKAFSSGERLPAGEPRNLSPATGETTCCGTHDCRYWPPWRP